MSTSETTKGVVFEPLWPFQIRVDCGSIFGSIFGSILDRPRAPQKPPKAASGHPNRQARVFSEDLKIVTILSREAEGKLKNPRGVVDSNGGLGPVPPAAGHDPTCSLPGRHVQLAYGIL